MESNISNCRACGSSQLHSFFDLGMQPFANSLMKSKDQPEKKYPLALSFCKQCSLVQLEYTADPKELFSDYFWVTSTSKTAKEYSKIFCENILERIESKDISYILEIASNDGTFLKPFKNRGHQVLGVDPAANIVKIAEQAGIQTKNEFFGNDVASKIIEEHGFPSVLFARNVLPHVANLHDFVKGLKTCMDNNTILVIEVHYAGKILNELHYDSIYHEHLCYFTMKSLQNLLGMYGLRVFDVTQSPISGGSIVAYASLKNIKKTKQLIAFEKMEEELEYNSLEQWIKFSEISFKHKEILSKMIDDKIKDGKKIVGYGASARSSTMLNFCEINHNKIVKIADQNILKHNLFTPGTHIPIVSPEEAFEQNPEVIFLLAWNFKDEIINNIIERYGFKGDVIVPLPFPPEIINIK